jgi:HSP20 family protein
MVSFLRSNEAVISALLLASSLAKTDAYARFHHHARPTTALASRMIHGGAFGGPSLLLSRDARRVMHEMDGMLDAMLGDFDAMFYNGPRLPSPRVRGGPPPQLLHRGVPALYALDSIARTSRNAHGIVQDDKQLEIAMDVQGAGAGDVHIRLDDDDRVLRISGETRREEGGISVHSRFDRAFALNRDVDTSKIVARIDDGVLTISAPKYAKGDVMDNVRRIDIVENGKVEDDEAASDKEVETSTSDKEEDTPRMEQEVDDTLIDLDLN